MNYLTG